MLININIYLNICDATKRWKTWQVIPFMFVSCKRKKKEERGKKLLGWESFPPFTYHFDERPIVVWKRLFLHFQCGVDVTVWKTVGFSTCCKVASSFPPEVCITELLNKTVSCIVVLNLFQHIRNICLQLPLVCSISITRVYHNHHMSNIFRKDKKNCILCFDSWP